MKVSTIEKPCIRQCCLNEKDVCMGCFRTFDEMKLWHQATLEKKQSILYVAKERKNKHQQMVDFFS